MKKLKPYTWMLVAGSVFLLAPFITKVVHVGNVVLTRAEALASGVLYLMAALAILLLVGVALAVMGKDKGVFICKAWAAIYGLVMVPFVYVRFEVIAPLETVAVIAYAIAWYYYGNKTIAEANAKFGSSNAA